MRTKVFFISMFIFFILFSNCLPPGPESNNNDNNTTATTVSSITINGVIVDTFTNMPISQAINVTFSGPDKALAEKSSKAVNGILKLDKGQITFDIQKDDIATLDFTIVVATDLYITSSKRINSVTKGGKYDFQIGLVNIEKTPGGVSVVQKAIGTVDSSGKIATEVSLSTKTDEKTTSKATITLKEGTIIKDASGNALTGEIKATVGYFSPKSVDALSCFPGGLGNVSVTTSRGVEDDGFFVSGGFVSIDITDSNGRSAEKFEGNSLKVNLDIPEGLLNPETNAPVKQGDVIPLWSYNKDTGKWTKEESVTRSSNGVEKENGKLSLSFEAPHLSYWNVDWHSPGKLDLSRKIILQGVQNGKFVMLKLYSNEYGFETTVYVVYDGFIIIKNVPSFPLNIIVYDEGYKEIGKKDGVKLGDTGDLEITTALFNFDITKLAGEWLYKTLTMRFEMTFNIAN
ncbi:MAG TPA: hypothetical protein PK771_08365, partial [Spirochaetota bacterium]|nr:hypothetical protein [Spirochaetota bacterium]